jgi:low temperature requirement protein LtrA
MSDLTQEELRVTPLELFFDLVFVFSITQVAALLAADPTAEGLVGGLLVMLLVWWAWSQYTWALNSLGNEATPIKLALIVAMGAVLFMALAVPDAAGDGGLWFAVGYTAVLLLGLLVYAVGLPRERLPDLARYALPALIGVLTVLVGGFVDGQARLVVWGVGMAIQIGAALASGRSDFDIKPGHFAERHALFVIIALGEIVVAVGIAASGGDRDLETAVALAGAFALAAVLWWAYFDWLAAAMERALGAVTGAARGRAARDIFTLGHIPLIAGVVLYAVAAEEAVAHPGEHLESYGRALLALGVALIVAGFTWVAFRSERFVTWERLVAGAVAVVVVLALRDLSGGVVLWVVAVLIATALVVEYRRARAASASIGSRVGSGFEHRKG